MLFRSVNERPNPSGSIGTGKTATPADTQDARAKVRSVVADMFGKDAAAAMRIQYGGSVTAANAAELFAQEDIDGGLIGGASLRADDFLAFLTARPNAPPDPPQLGGPVSRSISQMDKPRPQSLSI